MNKLLSLLHDPLYGRIISAVGLALAAFYGFRLDAHPAAASQPATGDSNLVGLIVGILGGSLGHGLLPKPEAKP